MSETAGMLRKIGIREEIIEQTLKGHEVSSEEYKLVEAYKARQMKDPVFVNAFLSGDPEARQKMNAHFDHSFGRHQRRTAGRQAVVRVAYGTATAVTSTSWGYRQ